MHFAVETSKTRKILWKISPRGGFIFNSKQQTAGQTIKINSSKFLVYDFWSAVFVVVPYRSGAL